ncbi:glycosyltransferase family 4 protein [Lentimicrobium sp.]
MEAKSYNSGTVSGSVTAGTVASGDVQGHAGIQPGAGKAGTKVAVEPADEVLFVTSYPPRECGIATYSQDMIEALLGKFSHTYKITVCALESDEKTYDYPQEVKYRLKTSENEDYSRLAEAINKDSDISLVFFQHEFGFYNGHEDAFLNLMAALNKPISVAFHTVLPNPGEYHLNLVQKTAAYAQSLVVMTQSSAKLLSESYGVDPAKIVEIPHGTHLVPHTKRRILKSKYKLEGRKVVSTFGLLSSGKGIETTIEALVDVVKKIPEVMFLVLGKTHPEVLKHEGERYRESLQNLVEKYGLSDNVKFVNRYLSLNDLLEYLQLTDIYLFTSLDPNQAVSGTFVYAMSCACPIISTPIPHAVELLDEKTGRIIEFRDHKKLARYINQLLLNEPRRRSMSINTLHKSVATAWENSAVKHALMFNQMLGDKVKLYYDLPPIKLDHLFKMTTDTGIIQFSKLNHPDIKSGYTLDDNARAMVAACMYYNLKADAKVLELIRKYLNFIEFCQQPGGDFLNYVDKDLQFTPQNKEVNLEDSNGRAIWSLGFLTSMGKVLPEDIIHRAETILVKSMQFLADLKSPRAMAFSIKGLSYYLNSFKSPDASELVRIMAERLAGLYQAHASDNWKWFENIMTYANSILPEAMLIASGVTNNREYRNIAIESFDFLLDKTFNENGIEVISNRSWLKKGRKPDKYGEQPIDVAYTVFTLDKFYEVTRDEAYLKKMIVAFNWFLGFNRLQHIIYNPKTGGCYDGLEESNVNLNQGAESLVSYLMARMVMENHLEEIFSGDV